MLHHRAELIDAHQREAAKQGPQQGFVRRIELDDEACALVIDARPFDARLAAQPRKRSFGQRAAAAERGNKEPQAPGHEMANCKFHQAIVLNASRSVSS